MTTWTRPTKTEAGVSGYDKVCGQTEGKRGRLNTKSIDRPSGKDLGVYAGTRDVIPEESSWFTFPTDIFSERTKKCRRMDRRSCSGRGVLLGSPKDDLLNSVILHLSGNNRPP